MNIAGVTIARANIDLSAKLRAIAVVIADGWFRPILGAGPGPFFLRLQNARALKLRCSSKQHQSAREPSMADKRKTEHEFIRQAIKEGVERMKPELHAASEAAHQLFEEAEAEDQADFERTVELGYVVDRLASFCGPNLAVLYELACALDEFHGTDEQEPERAQRSQPHRH
jgi:hypothetical protein